MSSPAPSVLKFTQQLGASFGMSQLRSESMIPHTMALRNAVRDATYMVMDFPWIVRRITSSYGYYRKYLRQMRKHGRANPEDFKDADLNELRLLINNYFHIRGPLMKIDFRIFNWMYLFMGIIVLYEGYQIQCGMDAKMEAGGLTWDKRKQMYDDDYEEDVRRR